MFFCLVIPNSKSFTAIYYQTAYVFVVNKMKMYLWKIHIYISAKTTFAEQSDLCFSRRRQSRRDLEDYFERSPPTSPSRLDIFSGAKKRIRLTAIKCKKEEEIKNWCMGLASLRRTS